MADALLLVLAALVTLLGMAWFALAKEAHWTQVRGSEALTPSLKNTLRGLGATCLVASMFVCFFADHPTMAVLVWIMLLAAGALFVSFTLTWRARWLAPCVAWSHDVGR